MTYLQAATEVQQVIAKAPPVTENPVLQVVFWMIVFGVGLHLTMWGLSKLGIGTYDSREWW